MAKRTRDREGAGKSDNSYIKEDAIYRHARSQANAYRVTHPNDRVALIDGNAGDGRGTILPQADLFDGPKKSATTPKTLEVIAEDIGGNCDLILSESSHTKRIALRQLFPTAFTVDSHDKAPDLLCIEHRYALWLSDPCGYSEHGVTAMRRVALRPDFRSDFIIVFNEGSLCRLKGTKSPKWDPHREFYLPMLDPSWWAKTLQKRWVARTRLIKQSAGFCFRLLIVADFLGDVAKRDCPEKFERRPAMERTPLRLAAEWGRPVKQGGQG